ncbi:sulfotransferase family 2 domain-containing protein [Dinoroseobacter sp. S124A]|uniref:sulfotransferase family 2 domain-containing protein n=1 Tax=Dinoroseobacter sp. S124A TaxID=3415128 RepID=UPI003C7EA70C
MLYEEHNLVFIHQRKCAGSTAYKFLGELPPEDKAKYQNGVYKDDWHEQKLAKYLKLAIVRNPWDRFISGWKYCESTKENSLLDTLRNPPVKGHDYRHLTRSQVGALKYSDGRWAVDMLISFEDLQTGFDRLCELLDLEKKTLPKVNALKDRPTYQAAFGPEEQEVFAALMADDIENLGYSFDKPGEPGITIYP